MGWGVQQRVHIQELLVDLVRRKSQSGWKWNYYVWDEDEV